MRCILVSDLHGYLIDIPRGDMLLIAGDASPVWNHNINYQEQWFRNDFIEWTNRLDIPNIILIAGNHCLLFERRPGIADNLFKNSKVTYLEYSSTECQGLKIYGNPAQRPFGIGWAFNLEEDKMAEKWQAMPNDVDIILSHGPPYGYGDYVPYTYTNNGTMLPQGEHTGSPSLLKRIDEVQPAVVCWGHIHSQYGQWTRGSTKLINASIVNESYRPVHKPIEVNL